MRMGSSSSQTCQDRSGESLQPAASHNRRRSMVQTNSAWKRSIPSRISCPTASGFSITFAAPIPRPTASTSNRSILTMHGESCPRARTSSFVKQGYILFARDGVLMAQPFNPDRVETTGEPLTIAERVDQFPESGVAAFSASQTGILMYRATTEAAVSRLRWVDRGGKPLGDVGEARPYRNPRLSPDGKRVAVEIVDRTGNRDIWLLDVTRGVPARFTFDQGRDAAPVWSGDGQTIFWQGNTAMYKRSSSGTGPPEAVRDEPWIPDDPLPDASGFLAHPIAPRQIWLFPLTAPIAHLVRSSKVVSLQPMRACHPTRAGSPSETRTQADSRSTCRTFRIRPGGGRSRPMAVFSRSGAATGRSCSIWRSMARS